MLVTLIHNVHAGEGTPEDPLTEAIRARGHVVTVFGSDRRSIAAALGESAEVVVVAGGDGTVRNVAEEMVSRPRPLAIFAAGTANNIAGSVGAFRDPEALAAALTSPPRAVDAALAVLGSKRIVFLESAGCGSLTQLMQDLRDRSTRARTRDRERGFRGELQRMRELLQDQEAFEAALDGESGAYLLIEVMNTRTIGPNLQLTDSAADDGWLDIVAVREHERETFDDFLRRAIDGEPFLPLPSRRAKQAELRCAASELHIDDDAGLGAEIVTMRMVSLSAALHVIAP